MRKWEYLTVDVEKGCPLDTNESDELGREGWELVSIYEYSNNRLAATYKRELT